MTTCLVPASSFCHFHWNTVMQLNEKYEKKDARKCNYFFDQVLNENSFSITFENTFCLMAFWLQIFFRPPKCKYTLLWWRFSYTAQTKYWNFETNIPEKEYRGLSPNFHIHASMSDLYIPTISLPILLEQICRPILGLYKSLTDTWIWKLGLRPRY